MKSSSLLPACLLGIFLFCTISCGDQTDKKDNDTSDTVGSDSTTDQATILPTSTFVTTPETMMFINQKVADYDNWLTAYEEHDSVRLSNGVHNYVIGYSTTDRTRIFVALKSDQADKAKAFGKSADLKKAMQKGGVKGAPKINVYNITFQDTGKINTNLRSQTTFTVKNWDTWQRSFDSSRQIRVDNGLVDRAYGHDVDNNKRVTLVVAVTDTTKAYAFWKSDQVKQLRAKSGVIGEPERFNFRIVKRY
ncbi:MAG: hypothetical protein EOO04_05315 [Chitinophagaceae bacterium]|nr:MAG: hypothetical protein EOO04_05315 [Chitinophagaceae bacterium]